ncbi:MAG: uroporphyrinogen decarboxylase family protein [Massiliimalia sp.]|jgi:uroporphyrinogen decarboxylase
MTSREKVRKVLNRESDEMVMWTGHPNDKTIPIYADAWGIEPTREAIFEYLKDDCRWISADRGYKHPNGDPIFNPAWNKERNTLSAEGCFADVETIEELDAYPWPNPDYLDFTEVYEEIDQHQDKMIFTGMWSPFFHNLTDFFGMENYFIKLYEAPEIVLEVTKRIVDFYVEANDRFFAGLGDRADVMFFGNDFGTQLDLFISPEKFREFVLPSFCRLIAVGKKYGKKIMLHSCGSIYRIIPDLIDAGVDILHPIQAQARGMSAAELAQYKDKLSFVGGIDAQTFFVNATPEEIKQEVRRVKGLLGPGLVVSPSHEEILPNVPAANILAMAQAAHGE